MPDVKDRKPEGRPEAEYAQTVLKGIKEVLDQEGPRETGNMAEDILRALMNQKTIWALRALVLERYGGPEARFWSRVGIPMKRVRHD